MPLELAETTKSFYRPSKLCYLIVYQKLLVFIACDLNPTSFVELFHKHIFVFITRSILIKGLLLDLSNYNGWSFEAFTLQASQLKNLYKITKLGWCVIKNLRYQT